MKFENLFIKYSQTHKLTNSQTHKLTNSQQQQL